jgi:hypothetical protein
VPLTHKKAKVQQTNHPEAKTIPQHGGALWERKFPEYNKPKALGTIMRLKIISKSTNLNRRILTLGWVSDELYIKLRH